MPQTEKRRWTLFDHACESCTLTEAVGDTVTEPIEVMPVSEHEAVVRELVGTMKEVLTYLDWQTELRSVTSLEEAIKRAEG